MNVLGKLFGAALASIIVVAVMIGLLVMIKWGLIYLVGDLL